MKTKHICLVVLLFAMLMSQTVLGQWIGPTTATNGHLITSGLGTLGHVGIGTTTPASLLTLEGGNFQLNPSGTAYPEIRFSGVTPAVSHSPTFLIFRLDGSTSTPAFTSLGIGLGPQNQSMFISNSGQVGIHNASPGADFHVTGSFRYQDNSIGPRTGKILVATDADGTAQWQSPTTFGVTLNACSSPTNMLTKITGTNTIGCSQIYDDGTSVGIGFTNPAMRNYSYGAWTSALLIDGGNPPLTAGDITLDVDGVTQALAYFATSDARFKKDIQPVSNAISLITKMNGVRYNWKKEEFPNRNFNEIPQIGFLAQDLAKVVPEAVIINEDGYYAVNYNMLIPVLTEAIKEQNEKITSLEQEIATLKNNNNPTIFGTDVLDSKAILYQNIPNPFDGRTSIPYFLPEDASSAAILVFDMTGKQVRRVDLPTKGKGTVEFEEGDLVSGMYLYSLVIDNQEVQTLRMILTDN